jgi:hypothetical protein
MLPTQLEDKIPIARLGTRYKIHSAFTHDFRHYGSNLIFNTAMLATMTSSNGFLSSILPRPRKRIPNVEGDISSVFTSLAGEKADALPSHFADLKQEIMGEYGDAILPVWKDFFWSLR